MKLIDVDNLTVNAELVKHGGWFGTVRSCRGTSISFNYDYKYCPHCGARMDEPENGEGENHDND